MTPRSPLRDRPAGHWSATVRESPLVCSERAPPSCQPRARRILLAAAGSFSTRALSDRPAGVARATTETSSVGSYRLRGRARRVPIIVRHSAVKPKVAPIALARASLPVIRPTLILATSPATRHTATALQRPGCCCTASLTHAGQVEVVACPSPPGDPSCGDRPTAGCPLTDRAVILGTP